MLVVRHTWTYQWCHMCSSLLRHQNGEGGCVPGDGPCVLACCANVWACADDWRRILARPTFLKSESISSSAAVTSLVSSVTLRRDVSRARHSSTFPRTSPSTLTGLWIHASKRILTHVTRDSGTRESGDASWYTKSSTRTGDLSNTATPENKGERPWKTREEVGRTCVLVHSGLQGAPFSSAEELQSRPRVSLCKEIEEGNDDVCFRGDQSSTPRFVGAGE